MWDFPCSLCDTTFRTKKHLANHVFIKHKEKESMQCNSKSDDIQCTYETKSVSNLNKHKKRVREKIAIPYSIACSSCVQNYMDCIFMTPLHCLFALTLFLWPEPLENVSGWVSIFKSLGPSNTTFEPLAAFRGEGQIIAHFLWRSYNLHIYYGIFCTGCSVGGQQRPISPQVWTKAWQRYFQCRQCSLLSSLVIQIPMVTAMGGWVNNLGLFLKNRLGVGDVCVWLT